MINKRWDINWFGKQALVVASGYPEAYLYAISNHFGLEWGVDVFYVSRCPVEAWIIVIEGLSEETADAIWVRATAKGITFDDFGHHADGEMFGVLV